jgi:VCBS repeat-containing protein
MADHTGQQLGKYRLTRLLGAGGFAEVYLGVHIHLGTEAAIKLLHTLLATPADIEKFRAEAKTIAALAHPNIVRVLDFDVETGTPYLVIDYAPNGSLRQQLPAGVPLAPAAIVPYLMQVADALQYAHDQKLVHRDVKPENMLLGRRNEVLLTDFGIATVAQSTSQQKTEGVAGTAAYMAPEQLQGKPRPASDLYALGVVVYEWLTGERPFQGSFTEVASQHLFAPPLPLREKVPTIDPAVEQVVMTALAKDPKERFGSVRAFANAFVQASGVGATLSSFSTQQAALPLPGAQPAAGQVTPHMTPQLSASALSEHGNQPESSVFFAPTQLTPPVPIIAPPPGGSGPSPAALPSAGPGEGASFSSGPQGGEAGSATYLPPGWAGQAVAPPSFGGGEFTEANTFGVTKDVLARPTPPPGPLAAPQGTGSGRGKSRLGRWSLVVIAAVVALMLIGGGVGYAFYAGVLPFGKTAAASSATVTITPAKSDLKNTFDISAVTGTPDASQNQVGARVVSATTQPVSQTVNATGQKTTPGTHASGTLIIYNFDTLNTLSLSAGYTYQNYDGCTPSSLVVVLDANVNLPVAPSGSYVSTTAPGHVQQVGSVGNFTYAAFHSNALSSTSPTTPLSGCSTFGYTYGNCGGGPCWGVFSYGAFTGGTDPQTVTVVSQSDINSAANSLIQANQPNAQQVVQGQLQSNERLIGTPQCTPQTSADHNAGDAASTVTVTVTFTCTGEAYDYDGALALGAQLLKNQAASDPGPGYAVVGSVTTTLASATLGSGGTVDIVVNAEGVWAYQFSSSQKQALAKLIAGKSKQDAMNLLAAQTGVAQVTIQLPGNGQNLPADPSQIMIVIPVG